jgi:hypothetical protein
MPTSAEPLVRAALDALRRQVESQLHLRQNLIKLDEALAARDGSEAERATTMGALRAADENVGRGVGRCQHGDAPDSGNSKRHFASLMLVTSLYLNVIPAAQSARPAFGLPAPEEMQYQAESNRTEDPPEEVWRTPENHADTDRDRPLQNAEPDRLRASRSRDPDLPLECVHRPAMREPVD